MMLRDEKGYIIGDYSETVKIVDGYKHLIIPYDGALSEYSKEAYNKILYYFQEQLGLKVFVDNLNHQEWKESVEGKEIVEISNRANISYPSNVKEFVQDFINKFSADFAESSKEIFQRDLNNTLISVCINKDNNYIHLELPYCTIEKMCDKIEIR